MSFKRSERFQSILQDFKEFQWIYEISRDLKMVPIGFKKFLEFLQDLNEFKIAKDLNYYSIFQKILENFIELLKISKD